jgi:hypothetical protein
MCAPTWQINLELGLFDGHFSAGQDHILEADFPDDDQLSKSAVPEQSSVASSLMAEQ